MTLYSINTFGRHFLEQGQDLLPSDRGDLNWVLSGIVLACKIIGQEIRRIGLSDARQATGSTNTHGEDQQGLDIFANKVLTEYLGTRGNVGLIASEEHERPVVLAENPTDGEYLVLFDPLDGSSNLELNVSVGTIFSVYRRKLGSAASTDAEVLQRGHDQIVAGYVIYGPSTMLVYTTGYGVHGFTLDPSIGTFVLSHPDINMPHRGSIYSVNESYADAFPHYCRRFLHWLRSGGRCALPVSIHWITRGRFSSHTAQRGRVYVSPNIVLSRTQATSALRSQSDRFSGRTSGWHGHGR